MIRSRLAPWALALAGAALLAVLLLGRSSEDAPEAPPGRESSPKPVRANRDEGDRAARGPDATSGRPEIPEDYVPPEVLAAAAGQGGGDLRANGEVPGRPEFQIGGDLQGDGQGEAGPPSPGRDGPPSFEGPAGAPAADRISETERVRRQAWVEKQRRRNALRVERMVDEFGLDESTAGRFAEVLDGSLSSKVALYESLDPAAIDENALTTGLEDIRRMEAAGLVDLLGRARYERYHQLDEEGVFVLPEEKQHPPGR